MSTTIFFLDRHKGRSAALDRVFDFLANLPREQLYTLSIEEWHPPLPHNLLARLKIPTRQMAAFAGLTYEQMNRIVHDRFYPMKTVTIGGVETQVSKDSRELTALEAREIEAQLHQLAADMGCPLTDPHERYRQYEEPA